MFDLKHYDYRFSAEKYWSLENDSALLADELYVKKLDGAFVIEAEADGTGKVSFLSEKGEIINDYVYEKWCDRKLKEPNLTTRQWFLFRFLTSRDGATQEEIAKSYPKEEHADGYVWVDNPLHGDHCRELWDDVKAINESVRVDKMIVSKNYYYKIGTREECANESAELMSRAIKLIKRANALKYKMGKDGQGKLLTNALLEMQNSKNGNPFVEAFPKKEEL